jgi:hypothetical protein
MEPNKERVIFRGYVTNVEFRFVLFKIELCNSVRSNSARSICVRSEYGEVAHQAMRERLEVKVVEVEAPTDAVVQLHVPIQIRVPIRCRLGCLPNGFAHLVF